MTEQTVVTCQATTKAGNPCKATRGLVDGYCASHRTNKHKELLEQVKKSKRSGAARKNAKKTVKPLPGANEELSQAINEVNSEPEVADGSTKLEFVGSGYVEIPVDAVQEDVLRKADELSEEEVQAVLILDGLSFDEALDIVERYEPLWSLHFTRDQIGDTREFAELILKVSRMPYQELEQELLAVDARISDINEEINSILRSYPANLVPAEEKAKIDALKNDTMPYKHWKRLLLCGIDFTDSHFVKDEPVADVINSKPAFEDKVKDFFKGLMRKGSKWLIFLGALLMLVSVVYTGEKHLDEQAPKQDSRPPVVFEENPRDVVVPVVVDDVPVDNADKSIVPVSHVVQDGDTLWDIAEAEYGDGSMWVHIYDANADMLNADDVRNVDDPGHWIHAGQDLHIPSEDEIALNDH